jgi:D-serine deaminase-like pyridoxal phosphate-dependent protein
MSETAPPKIRLPKAHTHPGTPPRQQTEGRPALARPADALESIETPAVLINLDAVEANIHAMAAVASDAGVNLRPHAKTHKMPQIAHMQMRAGSTGVTVAKLGEAEVMAAAGIQDLFVAYPIVGETKLERLCRLAVDNDIRTAADSWTVLEGISKDASKRGLRIKVLLEVDLGFGRCGLQTPAQTIELAERGSRLPGVAICGLMAFAGQSYAAKSTKELAVIGREEGSRLVEIATQLQERGISGTEVSVGSTPTSRYAALVPGVTEIRPGTYVFSDCTQVHLGWGGLDDCALTVLTTVVSRPNSTRAIVDVGTKGLTSDLAPLPGFGAVVDHPSIRVAALTEEHGILSVPGEEDLDIGDRLEIIPNHACGALNMFDSAYVLRSEKVIDQWEVAARGKMQ